MSRPSRGNALDGKAASIAKTIDALPRDGPSTQGRLSPYVPNRITKTLADLTLADLTLADLKLADLKLADLK